MGTRALLPLDVAHGQALADTRHADGTGADQGQCQPDEHRRQGLLSAPATRGRCSDDDVRALDLACVATGGGRVVERGGNEDCGDQQQRWRQDSVDAEVEE